MGTVIENSMVTGENQGKDKNDEPNFHYIIYLGNINDVYRW